MSKEIKPANVQLPLKFTNSQMLHSKIAHHMAIQQSRDEVILSFFEMQFPYFINMTEDQKENLSVTGIAADCVAKITISKQTFLEFVALLKQFEEDLKNVDAKS